MGQVEGTFNSTGGGTKLSPNQDKIGAAPFKKGKGQSSYCSYKTAAAALVGLGLVAVAFGLLGQFKVGPFSQIPLAGRVALFAGGGLLATSGGVVGLKEKCSGYKPYMPEDF